MVKAFADLRGDGAKTLVPFLTAGYPNLEVTAAILAECERLGVRICELGVPFSDPIADGPTIQASYTAALAGGVDSAKIFEMVRRYRDGGGRMALATMVSYSIVFRHGPRQYLDQARQAGFDATIIPDLPLEEAGTLESLAAGCGLANVMLIAPSTPPQRRLDIAGHSRGFIYYISVSGITGERDRLSDQTIGAVAELRGHTETPICVGFGISRPEMVRTVCEVAEGAIVGSAIIHRITDAMDLPADKLAAKIGGFIKELMTGLPTGPPIPL